MKRNIIFYFSDQQRWDTCGCYGQPLDITPNLDKLASEGVKFENAFSPQPVCGPCRALFQTGRYPTETGCFRNNVMLPQGVKTLGNYIEEAGYETAYIGKWHLASDGELEKPPVIDHTITAIPRELRGGYTGYWRAADVLEFTSHGYDGYVFDENNNRIDFKGYRADCINDMALEFLDVWDGKKPFFMTVSQIEPHHQNDRKHYEGPDGSKEKYKDCILFCRLGDFYEMFFEDAKTCSKELELTLTGKDCGLEERAPMCGIPHHAVNTYIPKLVEKGYKVAICEQLEDPKYAKGIVKRLSLIHI